MNSDILYCVFFNNNRIISRIGLIVLAKIYTVETKMFMEMGHFGLIPLMGLKYVLTYPLFVTHVSMF